MYHLIIITYFFLIMFCLYKAVKNPLTEEKEGIIFYIISILLIFIPAIISNL